MIQSCHDISVGLDKTLPPLSLSQSLTRSLPQNHSATISYLYTFSPSLYHSLSITQTLSHTITHSKTQTLAIYIMRLCPYRQRAQVCERLTNRISFCLALDFQFSEIRYHWQYDWRQSFCHFGNSLKYILIILLFFFTTGVFF
jgi:hypothetical protein